MAAIWTPLMAIYNYDSSILDELHVPTADELPSGIEYIDPLPELSDEDLRLELLMQLGELCPVYSDPEVFKQMIAIWDRVNHKNWLQLWQTTLYKYNPIWNKDGSYTETRELSANKEESENTNGSSTDKTEGYIERNVSDTVQHNVTGFDTAVMSAAYSDETQGVTGDTQDVTTTSSASGTRAGTEDRAETETITRTESGNIGVTTTQAMIREQREIVEFNIYNFIIESFKKRFMIQVY